MLRSILFGLGILLAAGCAAAPEVPESKPALELSGRVVDAADILNASYESDLTTTLAELEKDTRVQLVVATTPSLNGADVADYSRDLGNAWGIGDAERNDGLLIVVAPNERRVRIEVGVGLEDTVTDDEAREIIEKSILPAFSEGNFETGIADGVNELARELSYVELKEAA